MNNKYVLIVDDEKDILDVLTLLVESLGHQVLTANNGAEAVKIIHAYPNLISLVITDIRMPIMTGAQLAEKLKGNPPTILMSGYSDVDVNKIIAQGYAKSFIRKPFRPNDLLDLVKKYNKEPCLEC